MAAAWEAKDEPMDGDEDGDVVIEGVDKVLDRLPAPPRRPSPEGEADLLGAAPAPGVRLPGHLLQQEGQGHSPCPQGFLVSAVQAVAVVDPRGLLQGTKQALSCNRVRCLSDMGSIQP